MLGLEMDLNTRALKQGGLLSFLVQSPNAPFFTVYVSIPRLGTLEFSSLASLGPHYLSCCRAAGEEDYDIRLSGRVGEAKTSWVGLLPV